MTVTETMVENACAAFYAGWANAFSSTKVKEKKKMRAALTAALSDMVVVPREPTEKMIEAAEDFHANGIWYADGASLFGGLYKAMIAAAPPPSQVGGWQDIAGRPRLDQLRETVRQCRAAWLEAVYPEGQPLLGDERITGLADVLDAFASLAAPDQIVMPIELPPAMLDAAWKATVSASPDQHLASQLCNAREAHDIKMRNRYAAMIAVRRVDG